MLNKYTAEQLANAYITSKKGGTLAEVAKVSGIKYNSLTILMRVVDTYVTDGVPERASETYKKVVQIVRQGMVNGNGQTKPATQATNNMKKLEEAFVAFQEAITDVIVDEVEKRAQAAVMDKEQEMVKLRDKYEKELEKMQTIIVSMQDSSIVGMIKKKWQS